MTNSIYPREEQIDFVKFVHTFFHDEYTEPRHRLVRPVKTASDTENNKLSARNQAYCGANEREN